MATCGFDETIFRVVLTFGVSFGACVVTFISMILKHGGFTHFLSFPEFISLLWNIDSSFGYKRVWSVSGMFVCAGKLICFYKFKVTTFILVSSKQKSADSERRFLSKQMFGECVCVWLLLVLFSPHLRPLTLCCLMFLFLCFSYFC